MSVIEQYFPKYPPFNGTPRENQGSVIEDMYKAYSSGKKMIVIAAPTGCGKSVILYTLAKAINDDPKISDNFGAIFTTSQKVLQDQYERDFSDMFVLKGRANYQCYQPVEGSPNCDNGICLFMKDEPDCKDKCPYKLAKDRAILSPLVVTNLAYFITEANHVGAFGTRKVLVIDEAHNLENAVMNFVECSISRSILKYCELDRFIEDHEFFDQYIPFLQQLQDDARDKANELTSLIESNPSQIFTSQQKKLEKINSIVNKISFMIYNKDRCKWIVDFSEEDYRVTFKPIDVSMFVKSLVFSHADVVILSSATISKTYIKGCLGVDEEDFEYFEVPSTFPIKNRPIKCLNVGKMGYSEINRTLPKIVDAVDFLLDQHKDEKGIIHATSYKIADYIKRNSSCSDRLITHNSADRMNKLQEHIEADWPTVILSPSMSEGIDLKDDLSRFQIIVKIPFASLADKQISARMSQDNTWYANLAAVTMMQAYGRSIRSKEDHAITYILDSGFKYFLSSHRELFCNWFKEAIV